MDFSATALRGMNFNISDDIEDEDRIIELVELVEACGAQMVAAKLPTLASFNPSCRRRQLQGTYLRNNFSSWLCSTIVPSKDKMPNSPLPD